MGLRRRLCALALAALAPAAAGAGELRVACAVSLREPLGEAARRFERAHAGARVSLAFGASSALAAQARAGAPIDLLISADERSVERLARAGRVAPEGRLSVATNRLVVLARPGLPLRSAADLAGPAVRRVAVPADAVPLGHYAREWLAARRLLARLEGRIAVTEHARATLAAVEHGHADAAVVYATDARLARSARVAFAVPEAEQPRIAYTAAILDDAREPGLAHAFLDFLGSPPAQQALAVAGFGAPDP